MRRPLSAYKKKRLARDREMWASYGLQKPPRPRYTGLQGVLWYLTSIAVRMADFAKYGGICVDGCGGRVSDWRLADCGHYQTASKASTRFMLANLGLQLRGCNKLQQEGDVSRSVGFAKEIDRRYGNGVSEYIIEQSKRITKLSDEYLEEQIQCRLKEIAAYKKKLAKLAAL